ncbi:hypothetical protein KY360_00185 [Candidatus Woesearchaeota archaeon]|nr:hypothetical protein [Candidatus Woesearchaeota archaeon]
MRLSKSKRASLSLSINAIVILILAFSMLGLGLAFVRGMFQKMEDRASGALGVEQLINPPTRNNVMITQPADTVMRSREQKSVLIGFLNTFGADASCTLSVAGCTISPNLAFSGTARGVVSDEISIWKIIVPSELTAGTYLCTATIDCGLTYGTTSRDFSVKISS